MEELGDDGDDRDDRSRDPEEPETLHQRLNGATRDALGRHAQVRMVVVALVPERLARIVYSPFGAVPPKLP